MTLRVTYVGGPTALIEWEGLRLLTDPTLDPAGTSYDLAAYTLRKTQGPAIEPAALEPVDAVLLSHDHHRDNLDDAGRALLARAGTVLTTVDGAERLGGNAIGLEPWESATIDGRTITATPARHGPEGGDRGPVIGFLLEPDVWVSGDTVLFDGVEEVARRYAVHTAVLNVGAAMVAAAGPAPLTFTAAEAVEVARLMPEAAVVPLHYEGWEHFSEGRADVERAFAAVGLEGRLAWPF